jgi:hypothetical protein
MILLLASCNKAANASARVSQRFVVLHISKIQQVATLVSGHIL